MKRNFIFWIVNLFISLLFSIIFLVDQAKVFLGINILFCACNVIAYCIVFRTMKFIDESKHIICIITLKTIFYIFIILSISFVSSKILHLDFYITYQIVSFIMCFFSIPIIDFFEAFE